MGSAALLRVQREWEGDVAPAVVSYDEGRAPTDDSRPSGGMAQRHPGCENRP